MEIHLLLSGERLGPYSESQVRQYLDAGLVSHADLATHEGMEDWQPLDLVLSRLAASAQEEKVPPLMASQKTKRKVGKIVIQPILPLEPAAPIKKKLKTGRTTLNLESLRPTTSLPPINAQPTQTKAAEPLIQPDLVLLREIAEQSETAPPAPPPLPAQVTLEPAEADPAPPVLAEASFTPPEPAAALVAPPPLPLPVLLPRPVERETRMAAGRSWPRRIPQWAIYTAAAGAVLVVCLLSLLAYIGLTTSEFKTTSGNLAGNVTAPPPSEQPPNPSLEAEPKTAEDFSNRGLARQAKGDLDGALEDYDRAVDLDPKNVDAFYRRGLDRQAKGDLGGALADYTQVLGLDPKRADAFSCRGFIKQAQGDLDGALADYNQALLVNPKFSRAYYNVGLIEARKGNLDQAISAYDHTIDLDPKMDLAYYNRGVTKNAEGDVDGAIADFTQSLALNPNLAPAYHDRGAARQSKGDSDGALADYSQAVALDPKMTDAFYRRGVIKMQRGDLDGAVADTTQAIDFDSKNGQAYYIRGLARLGKNDLDEALADLKYFCQLEPRDGGADVARIYIWLIATEQNPQGDADAQLSTSLLNDWNSPPEDLTSKIAAFLVGHIDEKDLIANAASPDPSREPGQYCKVWYFAGMKRLLAGDMATAITYFQRCLATNQKDAYETTFARVELQALGQNREVAAKPVASP